MITLVINGERTRVACRTLGELLTQLAHDEASVATAIDGTFVPRGQRHQAELAEGMDIEIVAPMQGG